MNDSYSWDVVLSTTMQETRAVLSLGNLGSIPAQSTVTLAGPGLTATTIAEDTRIPVTLTGGTDMVYHLTVTRAKPLSVASESLPRGFRHHLGFPESVQIRRLPSDIPWIELRTPVLRCII